MLTVGQLIAELNRQNPHAIALMEGSDNLIYYVDSISTVVKRNFDGTEVKGVVIVMGDITNK